MTPLGKFEPSCLSRSLPRHSSRSSLPLIRNALNPMRTPSLRTLAHLLCATVLFILPVRVSAYSFQTTDDVVDLTAAVSDSVPRITLSWTASAANLTHLSPLVADYAWSTNTPMPYAAWLSVATSGTGFVAVGKNGLVFTSGTDAATWTPQNSGITATLQKVIWTGTQYVASGSNGTLVTSPDGSVWVSRDSGCAQILNGLAANGNIIVAVGAGGMILTSTNGGVNWSAQTVGPFLLNDVIWTGARFVAVGNGAAIFTSTDGATWTARSVTNGYAGSFNCAAWDGTKITIMGTYDTTLTYIEYQSSDGGATWTFVPNNANNLQTLVWTGSSYFGPVMNSTSSYISASGTSWTSQSLSRGIMRGVVWDGKKLVGVGDGGTVWMSTAIGSTSVTWSYPHGFLAGTMTACAWNGSRFVGVDSIGDIFNSDDLGATWTNPAVLGTTNLTCAAWSGSTSKLFIVGGSLGEIYTSPDGAAWTARASGVTPALRHITTSGSTIIAVGDSGAITKSSDGITWLPVTSTAVGTNNLSGVAWGSNKFSLVGYAGAAKSGTAFASTDGSTWTPTALSGTSPNCVEWCGTQFVAGCNLGIYYSTDGVTWSAGTPPATGFTGNYLGVASSGTTVLAVASSNASSMHSSDARTWTVTTSHSATGGVISLGDRFAVPQVTSFGVSSMGTNGQIVRRRVKGDNAFGPNVYVSGTTYADATAQPGVIYEYELIRTYTYNASTWTHYGASGFIHAGSKVPIVESRGAISLFCDSTTSPALAAELTQLQQDLVGDGWMVIRHDVPRMQISAGTSGTSVGPARRAEIDAVRNQIRADRTANPSLKQVYLFGRIAVPYVGNSNNDGHSNHYGAFPLDTYYGELDTPWSDTAADTTKLTSGLTVFDSRGTNIPGDGKLDPRSNGGTSQSIMPAPLTLAVGRVDLSNLALFPSTDVTETELLRRYLRRAHNYRFHTGIYANLLNKSLYNDAWSFTDTGRDIVRNTTGIFGRNAIDTAPMFNVSGSNTYTFGEYGGAGSETSIQYVGSSVDFGQQRSGAVFTYSFGSYFFDWDYQDNIQRGILAATDDSAALTSTWFYSCGNYYYGMSMGETIGWNWLQPYRYNTTSGSSIYNFWLKDSIDGFSGTGGTSGALHGDPALRTFMFESPTQLQGQPTAGGVVLSWGPSTAPGVLGYHVYRSGTSTGPFSRISGDGQPISPTNPIDVVVTGTSFTDSTAVAGQTCTYMVRAVRLQQTGGGSFYNQSQGVFTTQTAAASTGLGNPTALTVLPASTTQINLSWTPVAGATGYEIQRQTENGTWTTIVTLSGGGTTSYVDSGPITAGGIYIYRIRATGSAGATSSWSDSVEYADVKAQVTLVTDSLTANLPATGMPITIQRVGSSLGIGSVAYTTKDDSAVAGLDYVTTTGTLTWANGDNSPKIVYVPLLSRIYFAPRAFHFYLTTTGSSGVVSGAFPFTRVLINDSSKAPTWLVDCLPAGVSFVGASAVDGPQTSSAICSGPANNGATGDYFRFLYHPMVGNGSIVVRVVEHSPDMTVINWLSMKSGYAGISVTDSIASGPKRYSLFLRASTGSNGAGRAVESELRTATNGGISTVTQSGTAIAPYWMRITRSGTGDVFVGESSPNGQVWTTVSTGTISGLSPVCYWGLAHASNTNFSTPTGDTKDGGNLSTAVFDNFSLKNADAPSGMTATPVSTSQINLAWTGTSSPVSGYRVETSSNGTDHWTTLAVTGTATTAYSHTGLTSGQRAYYRVSPVYASNTAALSGNNSYVAATGRILFWETFDPGWSFPNGWVDYSGTTATNNAGNLATNATNGDIAWGVHNGTTPLWDLALRSGLRENGFWSSPFLVYTDKYPIPATLASLKTLMLSLQQIDTDASLTLSLFRFAVRVGSQWYVTQQLYSAPCNVGWTYSSVDLATNSSWYPLTFVPGSALSSGSTAVSLPSGDLTAYGIYGDKGFNSNSGMQLDNFVISVPDPQVSMAAANATTPTSFQAWAQAYGLPTDGTGRGALNAVIANDGIQNLVKAGLGIDPNLFGYQGRFDTGQLPVAGKTYLALTYTFPEPAPAGFTYTPQTGGLLSDWSGANVVQVSSTVTGSTRTIVIRDNQAIEDNPKRFIRLFVTGY